ncbi:MAG: WecB/TagA/CpsF family glycosyltransferase [Parcubacteria group bacterium]|nr:WecB/TagA/CpsF family glycosyltransferase [Parcubacteria group bacterium]
MNERQGHILGCKLDLFTSEDVFQLLKTRLAGEGQTHIITLNPEICLQALGDESYQKLINRSELNVADGIGLRVAALLLGVRRVRRVTGRMIVDMLCRLSTEQGRGVYLLGADEGVAQEAGRRLRQRYAGLRIVGAESGHPRESFHLSDPAQQERIRSSGAAVVFVALGAPKQEQWIAANRAALPDVRVLVGVGGLFDYEAGVVSRPPVVLQRLGMEWLYRLVTQPKRLGRIWRATAVFLSQVLRWKLRIICCFRRNVVAMIVDKAGERALVVSPWWSEEVRWQFPQGGIDRYESPQTAIFREMKEELGTDAFRVLTHVPKAHRYVWPRWYRFVKGYRGQLQDLFILSFEGKDEQFQLGAANELHHWQWVPLAELINTLASARREIGQLALDVYAKIR